MKISPQNIENPPTECARQECAANRSNFEGIKGSHTSQEAVQLHQNLEVDVVALGSLAVGAPHMVAVQVDTCKI
jgi:hypothetical protein